MLRVVMLSVILLNVVMLFVVASLFCSAQWGLVKHKATYRLTNSAKVNAFKLTFIHDESFLL